MKEIVQAYWTFCIRFIYKSCNSEGEHLLFFKNCRNMIDFCVFITLPGKNMWGLGRKGELEILLYQVSI